MLEKLPKINEATRELIQELTSEDLVTELVGLIVNYGQPGQNPDRSEAVPQILKAIEQQDQRGLIRALDRFARPSGEYVQHASTEETDIEQAIVTTPIMDALVALAKIELIRDTIRIKGDQVPWIELARELSSTKGEDGESC